MIQEEREERHKYKGVVKTVISTQSEDPMMAALKCVEGTRTCIYTHAHSYIYTYNKHMSMYQVIYRSNYFNFIYVVNLIIFAGFVKRWQYIFITIVFKSVACL